MSDTNPWANDSSAGSNWNDEESSDFEGSCKKRRVDVSLQDTAGGGASLAANPGVEDRSDNVEDTQGVDSVSVRSEGGCSSVAPDDACLVPNFRRRLHCTEPPVPPKGIEHWAIPLWNSFAADRDERPVSPLRPITVDHLLGGCASEIWAMKATSDPKLYKLESEHGRFKRQATLYYKCVRSLSKQFEERS